MDPKNAIEIRNISKSFTIQVADDSKRNLTGRTKIIKKKNTVLKNLSLDIKKGDVLGIVGRNGSGKSTFLSILARIMDPDTGTISRAGKIAAILELGMGFHPDMSGRENIYTKGELYGFSKREMDTKIENIIDYSGVRKYIDNPVRTYSSGMAARLAFAIMINVDSEITLVDEVLSVGDSSFSTKAKQHFTEMAEGGKTVLIVSHNLSYIEEVCNRVIWIENGMIAMDGNPKDVCAEYQNKINEDPEIIRDYAESGVPDAQYKLALMYRDGRYYEKDLAQYEKWLKSAADKHSVRAQVVYGDILMSRGENEKAKYYYSGAAERGDWEARVKVASLIYSGEDDTKKLVDLYEKTLIPGNGIMEYRYAELLLKLAWCDEDRKKAFDMFLRSAEDGYPDALHQVALMYRDGIGTVKDYEQMNFYLNESAEKGSMRSITLLADIYGQGKLLPKDREVSFKWSLKAAELGNRDFMYRVATMYRDGIGVKENTEESNKWFDRFAETNLFQQNVWASSYARVIDNDGLNKLYEKMIGMMNPEMIQQYLTSTKESKKKEELLSLLEKVARAGNIDAIYRLGNLCNDGFCIDKNLKEALKWYDMGASYGCVRCCARAAEMYRDGRGTDKNIQRSMILFKNAAMSGDLYCLESLIHISSATEEYADTYLWALKLMKNYAESGSIDAMRRLGNMYYRGFSVNKNLEASLLWYKKGASFGDKDCERKVKEISSSLEIINGNTRLDV